MFKDKTISKRVMAVIKQKILERQAQYESELETMENRHVDEKDTLVETHVNAILNKIL